MSSNECRNCDAGHNDNWPGNAHSRRFQDSKGKCTCNCHDGYNNRCD